MQIKYFFINIIILYNTFSMFDTSLSAQTVLGRLVAPAMGCLIAGATNAYPKQFEHLN